MKKFWNWVKNDSGERILRLEGPIDEDDFWGDAVTPQAFREELEAGEGDITVWINSPGGSVFSAAEIYSMLCDYKGKVTVKIDAIAASAASVVAMAGDHVLISPVGMIFIHDPMTIAMGNAADMEKAISTLNEVKESIINAYAKKSGLSRNKIARLMSDETWMNARKAVELGFADEILFEDASEKAKEEKDDGKEIEAVWQPYSTRIMGQTILNRIGCTPEKPAGEDEESVETEGKPSDVESAEAGVTGMFEEAMPEESREPFEPVPIADEPTEPGEEPAEPGETHDTGEQSDPGKETSDPDETSPARPENDMGPVIGMDGKTENGAMPYEILRKQLDFLK